MTQSEIRQRIIDDLNAHRINPMNDVLFKFIFGREERKHITICIF
ncbi:hypothetical protein [Selenomonas sp.]|nr:hypothetical protein [Selenomonas sp.]